MVLREMGNLKSHGAFIALAVFYMLLFLPLVGSVALFDWDEINFAEAAREMIVTGDWFNIQIGFEPFWEKPPLFIWMQAICMKLFGVNEFAARFPNVLIGLVTICILYVSLLKRYGKQAAIFSILFYLGSFTSHFYFKSGIIDPLFNLLIFCSVIFLVKSIETKKRLNFLYSGLVLGLAVLTKGPTAILLVGLTGLFYQLIYRVHFYTYKDVSLLIAGFLAVTGLYFGVQVANMGTWFLREFIVYQIDLFRYPIASHGQPFYYHFVVLLIGCFPMFIFALPSLFKKQDVHSDITFYRWMRVLFWVVLVVFSLVTTKIVHYSSLCYLPLSAIAGVWLSRYQVLPYVVRILLVFVGLLWFLILSIFGLFAFIPEKIIDFARGFIKDDFALAQLQGDSQWSGIPLLIAMVLAAAILFVVYKPSKVAISQLLVINILLISLTIATIVPAVEHRVQGQWKTQLSVYQNKKMAHFTLGFKSYAHYYYTAHAKLPELDKIKADFLFRMKKKSITDLNESEKKKFHNDVRDFVIHATKMPVSVSAKVQKFDEMNERYPELTKVFEGNGYGVWERKK